MPATLWNYPAIAGIPVALRNLHIGADGVFTAPPILKVVYGCAVIQDLGAFADAFKGRITPDTMRS